MHKGYMIQGGLLLIINPAIAGVINPIHRDITLGREVAGQSNK